MDLNEKIINMRIAFHCRLHKADTLISEQFIGELVRKYNDDHSVEKNINTKLYFKYLLTSKVSKLNKAIRNAMRSKETL